MAILIGTESRVIVQGITGRYGLAQTANMLEAGTNVVAGVTPGRGGQTVLGRIPVYESVAEAVIDHGGDTSVVYAPARHALAAVRDAIDAGLRVIVVAAENVPLHDAFLMRNTAEQTGAWIIGPNTIGLVTPDGAMAGSFPREYLQRGPVGLVSRSGSLALEVMRHLREAEVGQSTAIGVGGDVVLGTDIGRYLRAFDEDPDTHVVVYLGEAGGLKEYRVAEVVATMATPVVAMVVGRHAPAGKRMGHVGAIVMGTKDAAAQKAAALQAAGAHVVSTPWEIGKTIEPLVASAWVTRQ